MLLYLILLLLSASLQQGSLPGLQLSLLLGNVRLLNECEKQDETFNLLSARKMGSTVLLQLGPLCPQDG